MKFIRIKNVHIYYAQAKTQGQRPPDTINSAVCRGLLRRKGSRISSATNQVGNPLLVFCLAFRSLCPLRRCGQKFTDQLLGAFQLASLLGKCFQFGLDIRIQFSGPFSLQCSDVGIQEGSHGDDVVFPCKMLGSKLPQALDVPDFRKYRTMVWTCQRDGIAQTAFAQNARKYRKLPFASRFVDLGHHESELRAVWRYFLCPNSERLPGTS